jgi:hypothetical protein
MIPHRPFNLILCVAPISPYVARISSYESHNAKSSQSQLIAPPVWYSVTRVSKKFFSLHRLVCSSIQGRVSRCPTFGRDGWRCSGIVRSDLPRNSQGLFDARYISNRFFLSQQYQHLAIIKKRCSSNGIGDFMFFKLPGFNPESPEV